MIGKFHDCHPSVKRLKFHLEGEHYVVINEDLLMQESYVQHRLDTPAKSQFLAWMTANAVERDSFIRFIHELNEGDPDRYPKYNKDIDHRNDYYKACSIEYRLEFYTDRLEKFIKNYNKENSKSRCVSISFDKKFRLDCPYYKPYREEFRKQRNQTLYDPVDADIGDPHTHNEHMALQSNQNVQPPVLTINDDGTRISLNPDKEEMKENYTTTKVMSCVYDSPEINKATILSYSQHETADNTIQDVPDMNMNMTYSKFSRYNRWVASSKTWTRYSNNSRHSSIPRLAYAHIKQQELYYLRRLLIEKKGCWSYDDVRKHDDKLYDTYHETADAMGLLKDDDDLFKCMEEAVHKETSRDQIMNLFVIILTSYHPNRSSEM